ncbi:PQQ-binding-like beta-propeller repeat protein [Altericroceibacterium endophyticum]|uniref:PQQ-binding-like beta-propeller repeat protein n=1 Tax=Altericroceibacterium endophyticum TaxID=1808508 RepID=A0A6I4T0T9_9SPHN|nr:PQQ-binding-like beta-propeller repeat protein [Altericroceibacterium endophyticum]MXO64557.1 PQQ-binding-like beta-propeller repeat protein [Altericroceibacterium endophyticum]
MGVSHWRGAASAFQPGGRGRTDVCARRRGQVLALNPATGKQMWRSALEGRIGTRGINYWRSADGTDERLLVINNGMLRAVDAATGQVIDGFGTDGGVDLRDALPTDVATPGSSLQTDNPGLIYRDTIIVSLPAGAYDYASSPANIHGYDVMTGALKWTFNVVPREGEFGADTWPDTPDRSSFSGVHNWSESTVDSELGLVYIPTGTARHDYFGGNREEDNLFANSIVALDAETEERVWHYQTVHHDIWDFDLPTAPKLMTITKSGGPEGALRWANAFRFWSSRPSRAGCSCWIVAPANRSGRSPKLRCRNRTCPAKKHRRHSRYPPGRFPTPA